MATVSGVKVWASNRSRISPKILDNITVAIITTAPDKIDVWRIVKIEKIFLTIFYLDI